MAIEHDITPLGDTAEHAWTLEFLERCFPLSGDSVTADFNTTMAMCNGEPKHAQFAMQWLAQEIRSRNDYSKDSFLRFALGVLFTAYGGLALAKGRCGPSELPGELQLLVRWYPEIIACANELGPIPK